MWPPLVLECAHSTAGTSCVSLDWLSPLRNEQVLNVPVQRPATETSICYWFCGCAGVLQLYVGFVDL